MSNEEERLSALLADVADEFRALALLLPTAYERQWSAARVQARAGNELTYSDPTGEAATDPRRLRVRAAVLAAEREAEFAADVLARVRADLREALGDWVGT